MNRIVRIAIAMSATLLAGAAVAADLTTPSFAVTLPAAFAAPAETKTTQKGIETDTWTAKAPNGEAVVVSVSTMPAQIADPAKLIDSTRDSLLASVKGTLENEQPLPGTMPARRILFRTGGAYLRSRLVVNGDRLYQLLYVGRSEQQRGAAEVGQIFDSFRITAPALTAGPAH